MLSVPQLHMRSSIDWCEESPPSYKRVLWSQGCCASCVVEDVDQHMAFDKDDEAQLMNRSLLIMLLLLRVVPCMTAVIDV
jgi:hypothetical protein